MKDNKLIIKIKKSSEEVFAYYTNPNNTPLWWDAVAKEETSEWPRKLGTIYRSLSKNGGWNEFTVTDFKKNKIFELTSKDGKYHVRYTHTPKNENSMELEYYEWVDENELDDPFTMEILKKLKEAIEG
ncbi:SRPBCC family protein [Patescibacteria group bacterium]|nr:SRPBCC family protein [Patescibacteria group bacterium]